VFFAGAALTWAVYFHNVFGLGTLASHLPLLRVAAPSRSHEVWLFSLSCLAAIAVDVVAGRRASHVGPDGSRSSLASARHCSAWPGARRCWVAAWSAPVPHPLGDSVAGRRR
jgi:hypothetical protein